MPAIPVKKPHRSLLKFAISAVVALTLFVAALAMGINVVHNYIVSAIKSNQQNQVKAAPKVEPPVVPIVFQYRILAKNALKPGNLIKEEDIQVDESRTFNDNSQTFSSPQQVVGKILTIAMEPGQAFTRNVLLDPNRNLLGKILPGMRAISIPVEGANALNGLLNPGMKVDILLVSTATGGNITRSRTLMKNVPILAIGSNLSTPSDIPEQPISDTATSKSTGLFGQAATVPAPPPPVHINTGNANILTVQVSPEGAEILADSSTQGKFYLSLPSLSDQFTNPASAVATAEVTVKKSHIRALPTYNPKEQLVRFTSQDVSQDLQNLVHFPDGSRPSKQLPSVPQNFIQGSGGQKTVTVIKGTQTEEVHVN